jgi:hypothetical protein
MPQPIQLKAGFDPQSNIINLVNQVIDEMELLESEMEMEPVEEEKIQEANRNEIKEER